jgi:hypothetical protein
MADFKKIRETELEEIKKLRARREVPPDGPLVGLAFSGGGIRSATFNLGVLQGLATYGLLKRFDYLSTVSGGGYIGSWLISWIKRSHIKDVEDALRKAPPHYGQDKDPFGGAYKEPEEINFLRAYSNYLTPRTGLLGADTWMAIASYLRNLFLNQTILLCGLAAVVLVPRFLQVAFRQALCTPPPESTVAILCAVAGLLMLVATTVLDLNVADFALKECALRRPASNQATPHGQPPPAPELVPSMWLTSQKWVLFLVVFPIFLAAATGNFCLWFYATRPDLGTSSIRSDPITEHSWMWLVGGAIGYWLLRGLARILAWFFLPKAYRACVAKEQWKATTYVLGWAPIAGLLGGVLVRELALGFQRWTGPGQNSFAGVSGVASFGPPLLVCVILLTGTLHVGLMGFGFANQRREWWSRLAGWLLIWSLFWAALFALSIYAPLGVLNLSGLVKTKLTLLAGWIGATLSGVLAGKSPKTSGKADSSAGLELVVRLAPLIFILGLLALLSNGVHLVVPPAVQPIYWDSWDVPLLCRLSLWFAGLAAVTLFLSWRVDINEFSMHLLYRNRLVRCYLGASNPSRDPQRFTGFDPTDDTLLANFSADGRPDQLEHKDEKPYTGPYPILNATLNISHGQRLAWQERKAESFVFTPRYCGFDFQEEHARSDDPATLCAKGEGYRETPKYAYPEGGVFLGTAVATSGAAVSPNMGFHSSTPLAFLLTLFNVRLGWWLGNPRREDTYKRATPRLGLAYLVKELFGLTDDSSGYVYLSDGAHFENLAIYELVRRHCEYIVACDVGADPGCGLEDLGNAIRKIRSDLGVEIDIHTAPLRPQGDLRYSESHRVVGTICYPDGKKGRLFYIKSAVTGREPGDVLVYKTSHQGFPHQSTGDQWFDESQFESYRILGRFAVESALEVLGEPDKVSDMPTESLFEV